MAAYSPIIGQPTNAIGTTATPGNGLNSLDQFLRSGTNTQAGFGAGVLPAGQSMTAQGAAGISPALQFYQNILNGGPAAQGALAPQTGQINSQYNQLQQQQAQLHGRGGGMSSFNATLPFQKITAANNLWTSLLPGAAAGATQAGGTLGNLGLGQQQVGNTALNDALTNQLGVRQQDFGQSAQNKSLLAGGLTDLASAGLAGYLNKGQQ